MKGVVQVVGAPYDSGQRDGKKKKKVQDINMPTNRTERRKRKRKRKRNDPVEIRNMSLLLFVLARGLTFIAPVNLFVSAQV